jgi:TusA-related sulfurtransferase
MISHQMETSKIIPDHSMDIRDVNCPISLLRCQKRLKEIPEGAILEIIGNHDGIREDLVSLVSRSTGRSLVGDHRNGEFFNLFIQKGGKREL